MKKILFIVFLFTMICLKVSAQESWAGSWATAVEYTGESDMPRSTLSNRSVRQIIHVSLGGSCIRMQFSNVFGSSAVDIRSIFIADAKDSCDIDVKSARYLTFNGKRNVRIEAGKDVFSDALNYNLKPLQRLAVTICYGDNTPEHATSHRGSRTTSYIINGEAKPKTSFGTNAERLDHWYNMAALDVMVPDDTPVVAVIGNSITDGRGTTHNLQNRWTDRMAEALEGRVGVLNLGIGGNAVIRGGLSEPAMVRFDRDILSQRGVKTVIIFEGVNDIGGSSDSETTAKELIESLTTLVNKSHDAGKKVLLATICPFKNNGYYTFFHEAARQTVNEWIRTQTVADGVVDFDSEVCDVADSHQLKPELSDDWLHLNPNGYEVMGRYAAEKTRPFISKAPELVLLNHWDNPDGTVERGYAGKSIWKWDEIPADNTPMPDNLRSRYCEYGRINQMLGINGTVLNNVNAKPMMLSGDMLQKTKKIADVLRPYGMKVFLSVNFASPKALGDLDTADPLNAAVVEWWSKKVEEIYRLIPDFGGFLVKANSEGEPGPMDYGRTHVDGANMLARALKPHGGIVMWRAFVYSPKGGDRASQAYDEFVRFDGQYLGNVIIQIKNGPIDFQPREPLSPLFFGLKNTRMMLEIQATQEYTGNSIQTCFLAPMWKEIINSLPLRADGSRIPVAAVSNVGDCENWTANDLAMVNWYAVGRLANDPSLSSRKIAEDFLREYYTDDERFVQPVADILLRSYDAVVDYMMPLGLHHIFAGGHHYGPEPWCYHEGWREDWLPRYYHKADSMGIGFDRTVATGSGNIAQYPEPLRSMYEDINTCPEELLLWFHHVSWTHRMHNGETLWEALCHRFDRGVHEAEDFVRIWESIRPYIDSDKYERQHRRFVRQAKDAWWWRDACLLYFQQFSHLPLPDDCPAPRHSLEDLMQFDLGIDNYTAPDIESLP